jgi:hypothetical protein
VNDEMGVQRHSNLASKKQTFHHGSGLPEADALGGLSRSTRLLRWLRLSWK